MLADPGKISRVWLHQSLRIIAKSLQSNLPEDGKPLCIILYADKTRLSLFGTAKAYPVIGRIANIDMSIRNGDGVGGGCVVGWLPIVSDHRSNTITG